MSKSDHALAAPGSPTPYSPEQDRGARGRGWANLRLLREEDLGQAATGSLSRDLWW